MNFPIHLIQLIYICIMCCVLSNSTPAWSDSCNFSTLDFKFYNMIFWNSDIVLNTYKIWCSSAPFSNKCTTFLHNIPEYFFNRIIKGRGKYSFSMIFSIYWKMLSKQDLQNTFPASLTVHMSRNIISSLAFFLLFP